MVNKNKKTKKEELREQNSDMQVNSLSIQASQDRLPPQSIEAEQSVLGSIMIDNNAIIRVSDFLRPESFYRRRHQLIYLVMLEIFREQEAIDLLSVSAKLEEKKQLEETLKLLQQLEEVYKKYLNQ